MRTVMIIGGSGYLGNSVLQALLTEYDVVYATQHKTPVLIHEKIQVIKGGLNGVSSELLARIKPSCIFHCGRPTFSGFRYLGRKLAAQKAYGLNKKLIHDIKKSNIETKLIFASGSLAYGNSPQPHDEFAKLNPISYSRQYIKGELPVLNEKGTHKFKVLVLRFPWLLGNASWFKWFYLQNIQKSGEIPLFGKGNNYMSLIDVKDASALMTKYAEVVDQTGVYNIFSPVQIMQKEFAEIVARVFKAEIVPYSKIYPKLETAALEAFQSNIILETRHPSVLNAFKFTNPEETLTAVFQDL